MYVIVSLGTYITVSNNLKTFWSKFYDNDIKESISSYISGGIIVSLGIYITVFNNIKLSDQSF